MAFFFPLATTSSLFLILGYKHLYRAPRVFGLAANAGLSGKDTPVPRSMVANFNLYSVTAETITRPPT